MPYQYALDAAIALRSLAKLGRRESVMCVVDEDSHIYLTDTALILQSLEIEHPAGQYVVSMCQSFKRKHGCGVKTLLFMTGSFSRAFKNLRQQGIPSYYIVKYMRSCVEYCCKKLEEIKVLISLGYDKVQDVRKDVKSRPVSHGCGSEMEGMDYSVEVNGTKGRSHDLDLNEKRENLGNTVCFNYDKISDIQSSEKHTISNTGQIKSALNGCITAIQLEMKNLKYSSESDDVDDIDWFFEIDDQEKMTNNPFQYDIQRKGEIQTHKNVSEYPADESGIEITSMKNNNDSDSDFDECFDDIPKIVKMNPTETSPKCQRSSEINSKMHLIDFESQISHEIEEIPSNKCAQNVEFKGKIKQTMLTRNTSVDVMDCFKNRCTEDMDEFSLCFEDKDTNLHQVVSPDERDKNPTKSESKMKMKKIDSLLDRLTTRKPSAANILNNCRHFKTMESTLLRLQNEKSISNNLIPQCKNQMVPVPCDGLKGQGQEDSHSLQGQGHNKSSSEDDFQVIFNLSDVSSLPKPQHPHFNGEVKDKENKIFEGEQQNGQTSAKLERITEKLKSSSHNFVKQGLLHSRHFKVQTDSSYKQLSNVSSATEISLDITENKSDVYLDTDKISRFDNDDGHASYDLPKLVCSESKKQSVKYLNSPEMYVRDSASTSIQSLNCTADILEIQGVLNSTLECVHSVSSRSDTADLQGVTNISVSPEAECGDTGDVYHCDFVYEEGKDTRTLDEVKTIATGLCRGSNSIMEVVMNIVIQQNKVFERDYKLGFNVNRVNCLTIPGPYMSHPIIINGLVVPVQKDMLSIITENSCLLRTTIINGDVSPTFHHKGYKKLITSQTVVTAEAYPSLSSSERQWSSDAEKIIGENRIEVILARGNIDENFQLQCLCMGVIALGNVPYRMLLSLCATSQVAMATYLDDVTEENIIDGVQIKALDIDRKSTYNGERYMTIEGPRNLVQTAVYSHPASSVCGLFEQEFWRCVHSISTALKSRYVIPGGGSAELFCAKELLIVSDSQLKTKNDRDDIFQSRIWEEMANCFQDFHNTVQLNTKNQGTGNILIETKQQITTPDTDKWKVKLENNIFHTKTHADDIGPMYDHFQKGKYDNDFNEDDILTTPVGCRQFCVYDNLETKVAAWKTACETAVTISQLDMHIVTGDGSQTNCYITGHLDETVLRL